MGGWAVPMLAALRHEGWLSERRHKSNMRPTGLRGRTCSGLNTMETSQAKCVLSPGSC